VTWRSRRWLVVLGAVVGALVLIGVGLKMALVGLIDAERLAQVLNGALGPATDGRYRVEVDQVDVAPWRGNLSVSGIRLRPNDFGSDAPDGDGAPAIRFSADVEGVSIEGVELWRLIRAGDLEARAFTMQAPRLSVIVVERERPLVMEDLVARATGRAESENAPRTEGGAEPDSNEGDVTALEEVARNLPHIHIGSMAFRDVDATVVTLRRGDGGRGEAPLRERVRGLTLSFDDFRMDPTDPPAEDRFLWARDVRLELESMELSGGERARVDVGAVTASTSQGEIRIESVHLTPTHTQAEFLAGEGPAGDHVSLETGIVVVEGLQFPRLLQELEAVARRVEVRDLAIHVLSDKKRPGPPSRGTPAMPHDVMRELPLGITIEEMAVTRSTVTYAERGPESERPGSVTFADITARFINVTNDPDRVASEGPTTLEAETRLFDAALVRVRASIPLLAPPPSMSFFASVGSFPADEVNAILPDLEGIRVTEGHVDSARVDVRYGPNGATGAVMVGYRDLSIRQEDRNTGDQSLGQTLTSFLANTFVIRGSNRPDGGDPPREGRVDYAVMPGDPFFKIFWEAIREGLIDLVQR
jgi:hypothetical protein